MSKQLRSPLLGYNHNVRYHGRIFHIQTEDSGPSNPHLFTHLFYEGTILATKKRDYDGGEPADVVRKVMQGQHKDLMKELKEAVHDSRIADFFSARGEVAILEDPETSAPAEGPGASATKALDLDAIATPGAQVVDEVLETPPPLPEMRPQERHSTLSPGVYTNKGGASDRPFEGKAPPSRGVAETWSRTAQSVPPPIPPSVAAKRAGDRHVETPPPIPPSRPPIPLKTPPPIVILQPAQPRRPGSTIRAVSRSGHPPIPPADGVAVQRNVVIGVGGSAPVQPRPARPARVVPYIVSGPQSSPGGAPRRQQGTAQGLPAMGGRAAPGMTPPLAQPPSSVEPLPRSDAAERSFRGALATDKSLDEVILDFLSEENTGAKAK